MARERWRSRTIFLFAAIGSAVGLGNVWRFPYLTYKFGGGAFLVPYLIALFVIGIPVLMLEFAIGQKIQKGAIGSFNAIKKGFGAIGFKALTISFIVICYYAVIMGWALIYLVHSFKVKFAGDSESFFFNNVLQATSISEVGGVNWIVLIALAVVWITVYFCVWKGVKSVGRVITFLLPLPLILLVVLFFRTITLPGFMDGWIQYIRPDFTALLSYEIWITAIAQIFFSLSVAFGIMMAYSSYNRPTECVKKDAFITALSDASISIFAGFVVFGVIGYMANQLGVTVQEAATSGPGLAFIVFPKALSLMPGAAIFSVIFFITLFTLGLSSALSLVEAIDTSVRDKFAKVKRPLIAGIVCTATFLGGIIFTTNAGIYFLDIVDHFVANYNLVLVGIFEALAVGWVLKAKKLREFINQTSHWRTTKFWEYSIRFVVPIALTALLVLQIIKEVRVPYEGYPAWALAIGWGIVLIPIILAIIWYLKTRK